MKENIALAASIVATAASIVAIVVSVIIARKQYKLALLEKRISTLETIKRFLEETMYSWEWDGYNPLPKNFPRALIKSLFDESVLNIYDEISNGAEKCNELIGDYNHALRKGDCRGKSDFEIDEEIVQLKVSLISKFNKEYERAFKKWLKI